MRLLPLIVTLPLLWSCSGADNSETISPEQTSGTFSLRATGDIQTPEPMVKAAFLPNPVSGTGTDFSLNLPGQIILLSASGDIWQTTTEGEDPLLVSKGEFIDIYGYSGDGHNRAVLALSKSGSVSAFQKANDDEAFTRLTVSHGGENIRAFCDGGNWLAGTDGKLYTLDVTITDNVVAEIQTDPITVKTANIEACRAGGAAGLLARTQKRGTARWQKLSNGKWSALASAKGFARITPVQENVFLGLATETGTPVIIRDKTASNLKIEDGLSIRGLNRAAFVTAIHAPMGTAFSNGLILLADKDEPRLVMISMEYAKRELGNVTAD